MRFCYALVATTVALLAHIKVSSAEQTKLAAVNGPKTIETTGANKRLLRQFTDLDTEDSEERVEGAIVLNSAKKIDDLFGIKEVNKILDPKLADISLNGKKFGDGLSKKTLDEALTGNFAQKTNVFARWRANNVDPETVAKLLTSHPAIEKKYRFVYVAYKSYMETAAAKRLSGIKRKRGDN
ncbi:hypothetical protein PC129_g17905 [Phytophthora cactorum]|uniref:RxLR effector protein n=1 Tax=Phytophthora cactorum TaxID=29920 RepID=A0A329RYV8_9STRA|nr:hypothetical protein Pcac1_g15089 [Phytophthora cactorum]KAG2820228.1 hypothetical protein PC112_g11845 [Phytophthora cactorum]KAG2821154.1 hypothetical protein PC111_g11146 [Phytophthora cactorum]KAG2856946.1 hypothetical protein PC113_g11122 [Phytophthora cactorum]KAG2907160.1 hypothetical protein PC114_g10911 [Phytophthora cactorum]